VKQDALGRGSFGRTFLAQTWPAQTGKPVAGPPQADTAQRHEQLRWLQRPPHAVGAVTEPNLVEDI